MIDAASPRHPFEELLEQLTGRMSVPKAPLHHGFGSAEEAETGSMEKIIWIPGKVREGPIPYQMPDDTVISRLECSFEVAIYGGSPMDVYRRVRELCGALNLLIGPKDGHPPSHDGTRPHKPGFKTGESVVEVVGGNNAADPWATRFPVVLYDPITSVIYPKREIVSFGVEVKAGNDTAVETSP